MRVALAFAVLVVCAVGMALFSSRDIRPAAAFEAESAAVVMPPSRDVIVPATTAPDGSIIPEHIGAHFLFNHLIEDKISSSIVAGAVGNIPYNGGPVMNGDITLNLIFYQPPGTAPFPSGFVNGIVSFFQHASGSPFARIMTGYTDTSGNAPSGNFIVNSYVDTTTPPPSGNSGTQASPLTDNDIQQEIAVADAANPSWPKPSLSVLPIVFTSPQVWEGSANYVSFKQFCAYHGVSTFLNPNVSSSLNPNSWVPYVYMPFDNSTYANGQPVFCTATSIFPNGPDIDKDANDGWHELNESATDPLINAWTSANGEVGDLCNFNMGLVAPVTGANSLMNGLLVQIQQIWSNNFSGCVKREGSLNISLPPSIDFGMVPYGTPATTPLVVQNNTTPITPANPAEVFDASMASGSNPALSLPLPSDATIPSGANQALTAQLAATASAGPLTGTVVVLTDDPVNPQLMVPVSADVSSPIVLNLTPPNGLSFGNVKVGKNSRAKVATLASPNSNKVSATGISIAASPGVYTAATTCGATLAPGKKCKITVRFRPTGKGPVSGKNQLTVTEANVANSPQTIGLSGSGK